MPHLPPEVAESDLTKRLLLAGLERIHQGKVRDTFRLPDLRRLVVTTDRTSAFDFVLGMTIPDKGKRLHQINVFWRRRFSDVTSDLVAAGARIVDYLQDLPQMLRNDRELQERAIVVEDLDMHRVELVARGILTGSAWKMYKAGERSLWGYDPLPDGMKEWDDLPRSMFTPTNKADSSHDLPISRGSVDTRLDRYTIQLFDRGRASAREVGLVMVDTKFEVGRSRKDGLLKLGDEVFTPDSSRYILPAALEVCRKGGPKPSSFDKQVIRDYLMHAQLQNGDIVDVSQLDPNNPEHRKIVASIVLPEDVVAETQERYETLAKMLTGAWMS